VNLAHRLLSHERVLSSGLGEHPHTVERLPQLRVFSQEDAVSALREVHRFQKEFARRMGTRVVFAADEMYTLAGAEVPPAAAYEGFPQLENGIGMLRQTIDRWRSGQDTVRARNGTRERVAIVTGASAAPTLARLLSDRGSASVDAVLCVVRNEYFGDTVTVSGLLVGADIQRVLERDGPFDRVLLPPNCLKEEELFLDDRTRSDLGKALGVPIQIGFDSSHA